MQAFIDSIPAKKIQPGELLPSVYRKSYFVMGLGYYHLQQKDKAYDHWLKALQMGYNRNDPPHTTADDQAVLHFDSLILQNPKEPDLYFLRTVARQNLVHMTKPSPTERKQSLI